MRERGALVIIRMRDFRPGRQKFLKFSVEILSGIRKIYNLVPKCGEELEHKAENDITS